MIEDKPIKLKRRIKELEAENKQLREDLIMTEEQLYENLVNIISFTNWQQGIDRRELQLDPAIDGLGECQINYIARKCAKYMIGTKRENETQV